MKIILLGYMGSGKTGIGKLLASQMELPFLDLDDEISTSEHREVRKIFEESGEVYFRKKETETLEKLLHSGSDSFVLSLGGGTPCYGNNMDLLKKALDTKLIYLRTSLEELTRRLLKEREERPLIKHLETEEVLNDFIRKHLFERTYYYNQSNLIVDTDSKSMVEISEEIRLELY